MKQRSRALPLMVVVVVVAFVLGSVGTAAAGPALTRAKVAKIATKVVKKNAASLSVAHADTAGSASGVADGSITGADLAGGLKTFSSSFAPCAPAAPVMLDNTTFNTCTIAAPQVTEAVINSDTVDVYLSVGNVWQLPYTSNIGEYNVINYFLTPGQITITRMSIDNTPPALPGLAFRYVITPNSSGAAPAARSARTSTSTVR